MSVSERDGRLSSRFLPPLFLLLITCIAYSNANHDELLFDSLLLKSDDTPEMVRSIWQAPLRPGQHISYLTFQLNQAFNKAIGLPLFHVTSFLVVNVLLHALNACLVFYLLRATLREARARRIEPAEVGPREIWIPLAVSTLFAIHPLQASSIVYIFQRRGMLAVTFLLLAVLAYLRVRSRPVGEGRSAWPWRRVVPAAAIPVCYWLSFKSKELGLILPFFLMVIELCLLAPDKRALKRALRWVIPALGLTVVSLIFFLWSRQLFDPTRLRLLPWGPRNMWGPWTQFLTESRVAVHYWKLLLLPLPRWCCIDHEFATSSHLTEHYAFVAIAFHAVLLGLAAVAAWKRYTLVAIGIFWFYIALMPFAVVPQVELLVEYETYLPSIGLALILTEGLIRLRGRIPTQWQVAAVSAVAVCLLATTISRNIIYHSAFNLWSDAVEKSPHQARAHSNLAEVLIRQGDVEEGVRHYEEALRLQPNAQEVHLNYGMFLAQRGRIEEALEHYEEAVRINPDWFESHNGLGALLAASGRLDEAILSYREALRRSPDFAEAHYNLADALTKKGDNAGAIEHLYKAVQSKPDFARAHNDLGIALLQEGKLHEAIGELREAIRVQPDYADGHYNLGLMLERAGQAAEATAEYRNVLQIDASHAPAQDRLRILSGRAQVR